MNNIMTEQQLNSLTEALQDNGKVWDDWLKQQPINFATACKGLGLTPSELLDACRFAKTDNDEQRSVALAVKLPCDTRATRIITDGLGITLSVTETTLFRGSVYRLDSLSMSGLNTNGDGLIYQLEGEQNSLDLCQCDDESDSEHQQVSANETDSTNMMFCFERFELVQPLQVVASLLFVDAQFYEELMKQNNEAGKCTPDERIAHLTAALEKAKHDNATMLARLKERNANPRSDSVSTYQSLITTLYVMAGSPPIKQVHGMVEALSKDNTYKGHVVACGQSVVGKYLNGLAKLKKHSPSR